MPELADHRSFPCGFWPSPISPAALAGAARLASPVVAESGHIVWHERDGGRSTLLCLAPGDVAPRVLGGGRKVAGEVGYGGGSHDAKAGVCVFVAEHRLWVEPLAAGKGGPRPITPPFGRTAAPTLSPCGRWCAYVHHLEGTDRLAIVAVCGSVWPQVLVAGSDFYAQPVWSPDGAKLAFVAWNHPAMPWDEAEVVVAKLEVGGSLPRVQTKSRVAGGGGVSACEPCFSPDGRGLAFASDESGRWQPYLLDLEGGACRRLVDDAYEYAGPLWTQGHRRLGFRPGGSQLLAIRTRGGWDELVSIDLAAGSGAAVAQAVQPVQADYAELEGLSSGAGGVAAVYGSGPAAPGRIFTWDGTDARVVRRSTAESFDPAALARPSAVTWIGSDGGEVHGLLYRPAGRRVSDDERPPLVIRVHGGPTSRSHAGWNPVAQLFATRGYAYLEVNHRGSTGYGRAYAQALAGRWGELDVDDVVAGAEALVERGEVDPGRIAVTGGSSGALTALLALARAPSVFAAGVVWYAIGDLLELGRVTHKFEQHYFERLVGPLPAARAVYRARSPVRVADRIRSPVALFHGEEDRVVPIGQAEALEAALRRAGVTCRLVRFPEEGHGFRQPSTIERFWTEALAFLETHVVFAPAQPPSLPS